MMLFSIPLYQPGYWLTLQPPEVGGGLGHLLFVFFLLVFLVGMTARIIGPQRVTDKYAKKIVKKIGAMLVTMGLLGVFLFFLSYEDVQLFGARFLYPIWLLGFLGWGGHLYWFFKKKLPQTRQQQQQLQTQRSYLPRKKKK